MCSRLRLPRVSLCRRGTPCPVLPRARPRWGFGASSPGCHHCCDGRASCPAPASGHRWVHAALAAPHRRPSTPCMLCSPCQSPQAQKAMESNVEDNISPCIWPG
eukprot:3932096-Rhodomonas_salina.2